MANEWQEQILADEEERFERYAQTLLAIQRSNARSDVQWRGLHAKSHAAFTARFTALPTPSELKCGLFERPATYDAYVRFSSGAPHPQQDHVPDIRGIAIKVLDVDGPKTIPGLEAARTQDFLFVQLPASPFRGPDEFVRFVQIASGKRALALPRLVSAFGPIRAVTMLRAVVRGLKNSGTSFAEQRFFSGAPLRFGNHAAKLDLCPIVRGSQTGARAGSFAQDLTGRVRAHGLAYEMRAQLYVDSKHTPIEDATVVWDERVAPFIPVARLELPAQDASSERGRLVHEYVERLSFDPWHALLTHRPLGAMMRARNYAYRLSAAARGAIDERRVELRPDGSTLW